MKSTPLRILLIEDNRAEAGLIQGMLESRTVPIFDVIWVDRIQKAIEQLRQTTFDAVVLDLTLPDSKGLATLERIQAADERIPIIISTGIEDEELGIQAIRNGAQDYLIKSILDRRTMARAIQYAIDRKQSQVALHASEQRFKLLSETAATLLSAADPQPVINQLCHDVMKHLDCQFFFNFMTEQHVHGTRALPGVSSVAPARLRLNAYAGISETEARAIETLEYGVAVCGCAAQEGCRIVAENIQNSPDPRTELVKTYGIRAYACHPLQAPGQVIGTLSFGTTTRDRFTDDELAVMKTVADQVSVAMQRLMAQMVVERAKQEWERTFDTVPDLIAILDHKHRVVRVNQAMASKLGCSPEACVGASCFGIVHGCNTPINSCPHTRTLSDGKEHTAEVHEEHLGGDFLVTTSPLHDAEGRMIGAVHVARDITERKRREDQLQRLNRALNALSHSGQSIIHATNEEEFLQEACRIIVQDCGYAMVWVGFAENDDAKSIRPAAFSGFEKGYLETLKLTWADTERGRGPTGMAIRTGKMCRCLNMLDDPSFLPWRNEAIKRGYASSLALPLLSNGTAFGVLTMYARQPNGFSDDEMMLLQELAADFSAGISTFRTRAELTLMQQREKEDAIRLTWGQSAMDTINAMREGVVLLQLDGTIISVNPSAELITGLAGGDSVGRNLESLLPRLLTDDDLRTALQGLAMLHRGGIPRFRPLLLHKPDGTATHVLPSLSLMDVPNDGGRLAVLTLKDMTDLYEMTHQLELSERNYRELVENANSIIMRITPDHTITFFNEYAQAFFGFKPDEIVGHNVLGTIVPMEDSQGQDLREVLKDITLHPEAHGSNENENVCKDGRRVWVHWANRAVRNDQGEVVEILCVGTDITKRREMEEEARRYQKRLRDLGERLAVAEEEDRWRISRYIHDSVIQNLSLSNIRLGSMAAPLLDAKLTEEAEKLHHVRKLLTEAIDECRMVMSDLTPSLLYELGLIPALTDLSHNVKSKYGRHVAVEDDGQDIPLSNSVRSLLFQAVRELVMNALKHAGPCGIRVEVTRGGSSVILKVKDTGKGFDPALMTARHDHNGGFGMFNIRHRLESLGGQLSIESSPGHGTTVTIRVPVSQE